MFVCEREILTHMHRFTVARKEKTGVFKYSIVDRYTRAYTHAHSTSMLEYSYVHINKVHIFVSQIVHVSQNT